MRTFFIYEPVVHFDKILSILVNYGIEMSDPEVS